MFFCAPTPYWMMALESSTLMPLAMSLALLITSGGRLPRLIGTVRSVVAAVDAVSLMHFLLFP